MVDGPTTLVSLGTVFWSVLGLFMLCLVVAMCAYECGKKEGRHLLLEEMFRERRDEDHEREQRQ